MSDMARTEAIEVLKDIVSKPMLYSNHIIGACRVALASLETDEAYQLEFERTTTPQEPRKGHWIKMPLIEASQTYTHKCSLCGRRILAINVGLSEFPYCHCGAKMEVEGNDRSTKNLILHS